MAYHTPLTKKTADFLIDRAKRNEQHPALRSAWSSEIQWKVNRFPGTLGEFLDLFLPCQTRCPDLTTATKKIFTGLVKEEDFKEPAIYTPVIRGLRLLVKDFPPKKRLCFVDSHSTQLNFPHQRWAENHGKTAPDISVLQAGVEGTKVSQWQDISLVFEAKNGANYDPTCMTNESHVNTMIQLSKNARNLLLAHNALSCFVVGIYARNMRIFHFDHAGGVASPPFDYIKEPGHLREFLWRFVDPEVGNTVVGMDDTSTVPSNIDLRDARKKLRALDVPALEPLQARWISIPSEPIKYLTTRSLALNPRVFSRATLVREALSLEPERKLVAVKDAWRQADVRQPETAFYEAMAKWFEEHNEQPFGLATMLCGADLGAELEPPLEVRAPGPSDSDTSAILDNSAASTSAAPPSTPPPSRQRVNAVSYHHTISAFFRDCKDWRKFQRNHMRLILNIVGRPLNGFNMTKVLIQAFCDAIKGHRQAYNIGILHRDVSEGNILIVDGQPFQGMLVDFDYASFYLEAMAELEEFGQLNPQIDIADLKNMSSEAVEAFAEHQERLMQGVVEDSDRSRVSNELKERTGTLRFMAIAFLDLEGEEVVHLLQHDLESFYWVLVWVVLRHTNYFHRYGPDTCNKLFGGADEEACKSAKLKWINSKHSVVVKDNRPLTVLLISLTRLVARAYEEGEPLTYESVLEIFEKSLARDDWPKNDKAIPVQHIDTSKEVPVQNEPDVGVSGSLKRPAETEYPSVRSKRKKGDGETLSRHGQD
ncbi:hypothetical protein B0H21DRAFT_809337 [Amylocystis lapponica]|nr:hypothetical protein B0H21DRAFT_809337 [Amylocystis lapponica]